MGRITKGLGLGVLMLVGAAALTGIVALNLESRARTPIDRAYSPTADALVDRWGLPTTASGNSHNSYTTAAGAAEPAEQQDRI